MTASRSRSMPAPRVWRPGRSSGRAASSHCGRRSPRCSVSIWPKERTWPVRASSSGEWTGTASKRRYPVSVRVSGRRSIHPATTRGDGGRTVTGPVDGRPCHCPRNAGIHGGLRHNARPPRSGCATRATCPPHAPPGAPRLWRPRRRTVPDRGVPPPPWTASRVKRPGWRPPGRAANPPDVGSRHRPGPPRSRTGRTTGVPTGTAKLGEWSPGWGPGLLPVQEVPGPPTSRPLVLAAGTAQRGCRCGRDDGTEYALHNFRERFSVVEFRIGTVGQAPL